MEQDTKSEGMINETFHALNERHNNIYRFVLQYNDYIMSLHYYGEGVPLTMIEAHILTYIEDHPGATITDLTSQWKKTKGALSQTVSRLESKALVEKRKENGNAKNLHLYPTPLGVRLSKAHKLYDTVDIVKTMEKLRRECSPEEIESFYKVLAVYNKVIQEDFKPQRIGKRSGIPAEFMAKSEDTKSD